MSFDLRSFWLRKNWDSLLAALAGMLIIHYFCRHSGIGVSPDSVDYISTASNIRHHGSASNFTGSPLVNFPLGYPILLSAIEWVTGKDAVTFGPVVNEILFGVLILLCGVLMEGFAVRSKLYKWALLSIIVLSPCLLEVYSMLWSETLFLVLVLLFFLCCKRWLMAPGLLPLLIPALVAGSACLVRYAGITLIATGGLLLCWQTGLRMKAKTGRLLFFGVAAFALPFINILHNRMITGTLAGHRESGTETFGAVLCDFGNVFWGWLGGASALQADGLVWAAVLGAAFLIAFSIVIIRGRRPWNTEHIAILYFVVYAVFILLVASFSRFQQLDSRLLAPLFIPWIWGCTYWIPRWMSNLYRGMGQPIAVYAVFSGWLFFQIGQLEAYAQNWEGIRDAGIPGYTEDDWTHSPTMGFVREQFGGRAGTSALGGPGAAQDSIPMYSNADDAIWFLTGQHSLLLPHKDFLNDIRALVAQDRFYVAWFNDGYNPDLVNIDVIGRYKRVAWVKRFEDGAVYYFTNP